MTDQGCVVAATPQAAQAGAAMLHAGGNAFDAACAAAWALGVCEPAESGLGGQTTMLLRKADGTCVVVDGHSRAPASLQRKRVGRRAQKRGMKSVSVPSTAATLDYVQKKYGKLKLADVIGPAIVLAHEGYAISKLQRRLLKWTVPFFQDGSIEANLFLKDGAAYARGELFRQPVLGKTLERLAVQGVEDFYQGKIASEIARDMKDRGGLITAKDLAELNLPVEREPLKMMYRGFEVLSLPPPGGGVQLLLALQILQKLWRPSDRLEDWRRAMVQATLSAFRERERWPDHPADMTPSIARWMASPERAEAVLEALRDGRSQAPLADSLGGEDGNTTHLCAIDQEGNVVSLTQSIQSVFGAKVAHPTLGFVYNNYLSTCPRDPHPYQLRGGGIPQSNAAPTLVLSGGEPLIALGSAGSRRIVSSLVQVLSAMIDHRMSVEDALKLPRVHPLVGGGIWAEKEVGETALVDLEQKFGKVRRFGSLNYKFGAVQILTKYENTAIGAGDPRRDGSMAV